jgi:DNA invertase Pin-like site-specific DNA recombinase
MSQKPDPILKKLDELTEKLDVLTMLIAAKPNGEQINSLLKDKNQREQIRILKEFGFPPREMALLIGTTLNTVRKTISEMESEKEDKQQKKQQDKQVTVKQQ